jgi:predicted DNA-binding transcriptional regulator AlpA
MTNERSSMDEKTLALLVGRRELEDILSLRPTRLNEILRTDETFPRPVKVLSDGTRLWDESAVRQWNASRGV